MDQRYTGRFWQCRRGGNRLGDTYRTGGSGGGGDGFLNIEFGSQGIPISEEDTIYSSETNVTGDYTGLQLLLSFQAFDILPGSASVLFHAPGSGRSWKQAFTVSSTASWESLSFSFADSTSWVGGTEAEFLVDIADVDYVGVNIDRSLNVIQQDYGIDDWEFAVVVPEPSTFALFALGTLGLLTHRRRRKAA